VKAASAKQRAELGSAVVLTPVRRSTRHSVLPSASGAEAEVSGALAHQLESTNWAYSPNPALVQAAATPPGMNAVIAGMNQLGMDTPGRGGRITARAE
jgi:hypothetical protein